MLPESDLDSFVAHEAKYWLQGDKEYNFCPDDVFSDWLLREARSGELASLQSTLTRTNRNRSLLSGCGVGETTTIKDASIMDPHVGPAVRGHEGEMTEMTAPGHGGIPMSVFAPMPPSRSHLSVLQQPPDEPPIRSSNGQVLQLPSGSTRLTKKTTRGRKPSGNSRQRQRQLLQQLEAAVTEKLGELQVLEKENVRLKRKSAALEKMVSSRQEQLELLEGLDQLPPIQISPGGRLPVPHGRVLHFWETLDLSSQQLQKVSLGDARATWTSFISRLGVLLSEVEAAPGAVPEKEGELLSMVKNCSINMRKLALMDPTLVVGIKSMNLRTGEVSHPGWQFYEKVAQKLLPDVNRDVRGELQVCYKKYLESLEEVRLEQQRVLVAMRLAEGLPVSSISFLCEGGALLQELVASLRKEWVVHNMMAGFSHCVLPPRCLAKMWLMCYPYSPDCNLLCATLVRGSHQEP